MVFRFTLVPLLLLASICHAACGERAAGDTRPRIGLVLSGGGARGAAHIGVLEVLEQLRVPVDCIAATSMGAIVGAAYASGAAPAELRKRMLAVDWTQMFNDEPPRTDLPYRRKQEQSTYLFKQELGLTAGAVRLPKGVINGQKFELLMRELAINAANIDDFDKLPIPFRAIATDAENGKMKVFAGGDLAAVMRASMSVPGAMAPAEIDDRIYIDGGLTRNLPVDVVRAMGADVVIAVNLGTPLLKRESLTSVIGFAVQMINILTEQNVEQQLNSLAPSDVLISPELGAITASDFDKTAAAIDIGRVTARQATDRLQKLSLSDKAYLALRQSQRAPITRLGRIDEVRVEPLDRINPEVVRDALDTKPGKEVDLETINADISRLYGRGDFERINYRLFNDNNRYVLSLKATEKSWGPNYLRFGLGLSSDFQGEAAFNLAASLNQTWLNRLGGEWRNEIQIGQTRRYLSEFYQPLDVDGHFFISPRINGERRLFDLFNGDQRVAQYAVATDGVGLDGGVELGKWGELRLGLMRGKLNARTRIGQASLPDFDVDQGAVTGRLVFDQQDDPYFPRHGSIGGMTVFAARHGLGSDDEYTKIDLGWTSAFSYGDHTWAVSARSGRSIRGALPAYDLFTLGGFLQLSGYKTDQLVGQSRDFGRLVYFHRVGALPRAAGGNTYAGFSFEAGRVGERPELPASGGFHNSLGLFFGADTILGPLYLGYGWAQAGHSSFYLFLGRP
jgi:NTE family protein